MPAPFSHTHKYCAFPTHAHRPVSSEGIVEALKGGVLMVIAAKTVVQLLGKYHLQANTGDKVAGGGASIGHGGRIVCERSCFIIIKTVRGPVQKREVRLGPAAVLVPLYLNLTCQGNS